MTETEELVRAPYDDLEFTEERCYMYNGRLFVGVGYEEYHNGTISCEIEFCDGLEDGLARDFYPTGLLKGETPYRKGLKHGIQLQFGLNGERLEQSEFIFDVLMTRTRWDSSGNTIERFARDPDDSLSLLAAERQKKPGN